MSSHDAYIVRPMQPLEASSVADSPSVANRAHRDGEAREWLASVFTSRGLILCEIVAASALLALFFAQRDLPMVDLPQHAAQLAIWTYSDDPLYHAELFSLNPRTPYLLAYGMARLLAPVLGVNGALKAVTWVAVCGHMAGLHLICVRLRHDCWLALLGIPLGLGYCFLFGFVSFIIAVPLIYVSAAIAVTFGASAVWRDAIGLTAALVLLLFAHGIAFAQAYLIVVPLLLAAKGRPLLRFVVLATPVAFAAVWLQSSPVSQRLGSDLWEPSWQRILSLPGLLVGSGAQDNAATVAGSILLATVASSLGKLSPVRMRWGPLVGIGAGYFAFPEMFRGYGPLWPRFAVLVVPAFMLLLTPSRRIRLKGVRRLATVVLVAAWVMLFAFRIVAFNRETQPIHTMTRALPVDLRIRAIVFEPQSQAFPGLPALNHLAAQYFVEKGGVQAYSFAMYPSSVIRYRDGIVPKMSGGQEWNPDAFDFESESQDYDCFWVHSRRDRTGALFGSAPHRIALRVRLGDWAVYCRTDLR